MQHVTPGINLLSLKAQRALRREYFVRFSVVCALLVAVATCSGAALLVPSYLLAQSEADAAHRFLQASEQAVALGNKGGAPGIVAVTSERVHVLQSYTRPPLAARVLSAITTGIPSGVALKKITLAPGETASGAVNLSGTAATRTDLLAFVQKLQGEEMFSGVSLPVSDLATGVNVPFTLSFSYVIPPL